MIGEAESGEEALELARKNPPDILILDMSFSDKDGLEVVRALRSGNPGMEFVMVIGDDSDARLGEAMGLGVRGCVHKKDSDIYFAHCLKSIGSGVRFLSPSVSLHLMSGIENDKGRESELNVMAKLTPIKRKILRMVSEHKTSREIAQSLSLSVRTVQNHRADICLKLGLKGAGKLLQFAVRNKDRI